jgi:hypothetical protein
MVMARFLPVGLCLLGFAVLSLDFAPSRGKGSPSQIRHISPFIMNGKKASP